MAGFRFADVSVEPFMFLCMKVFSLDMVTLPQILLENVCLTKHNESKCSAMFTGSYKDEYDVVQEESTLWFGGYIAIATFLTILTLPFVASLSDEIGRRKAMILYPVGQIVLDAAFLGILNTGMKFPTWIAMALGVITGLVGDIGGLYLVTSAYIVDKTTEENRTLRINLLEASSMLGGFSATITSGYIIESFGFQGIYVVNLALLVLAVLYLVLFINPVERQRKPCNALNLDVDSFGNMNNEQNCQPKMVQKRKETREEEVSLDKERKTTLVTKFPARSNSSRIQVTSEGCHDNKGFSSNDNVGLVCHSSATDEDKSAPLKKKLPQTKIAHIEMEIGTSDESGNEKGDSDNGMENENFDDVRNDSLVKLAAINSEKQSEKTESRWKKLLNILKISNPISNFKRVVQILKADGRLCYGLALFLLALLVSSSYSGELAVMVFYVANHPYLFGSRGIGLFFAFQSALLAIVGLVAFNYLFTKILKMNDHKMLAVTSAAYVVYYVVLGFSDSKLMLYLIQIVHAVATLNLSTIRAMVSKTVESASVGLIFSALLIIETVAVLIGSIVGPIAYSKTVALNSGTVFFLLAAFMLISCFVSLRLLFVKHT